MLNRRNCIEDHEAMGSVQTTEQQAEEAKKQASHFKNQQTAAETSTAKLLKNPALQAIAHKVALGDVSDQSFSFLTNTDKPTEEEKPAIVLLALC